MKTTDCMKKQRKKEVYEETLSQLKEIIHQIGEKANEEGIGSLKDRSSRGTSSKTRDLILPHHQISAETDRGLVGVLQKRKAMSDVKRKRADRNKWKKNKTWKQLESHSSSV